MKYEEFVKLAHSFEGKVLETITGKEFRVGVYLDCPFFHSAFNWVRSQ